MEPNNEMHSNTWVESGRSHSGHAPALRTDIVLIRESCRVKTVAQRVSWEFLAVRSQERAGSGLLECVQSGRAEGVNQDCGTLCSRSIQFRHDLNVFKKRVQIQGHP